MSLRERLISRIVETGPMSVADYMTACLHDPREGYYATRPRLGASGDFITAPHVSQMFGELLGLWAVEAWTRLGRPERFRLVELGPGDGAMMADMLRAARLAPEFLSAAEVWLVETSDPLKAAQARSLAGLKVRWAGGLEDLPADAPAIILANEFLDCLPIRQYVVARGARLERRIGLDASQALMFTVPALSPLEARAGRIHEGSCALTAFGATVGAMVARTGGVALFIDYGRDAPGSGDTLQALRDHQKESPLAHPGAADLTAHVDFPSFVEAARGAGAEAPPLVSQGDFLRRLGIAERAAVLTRANPDMAETIARQCHRLIAPDAMGALFKVARIHHKGFDVP